MPVTLEVFRTLSGLKASRFYPYLFAALIIGNIGAFGLRLYHTDDLYALPADVAAAPPIQPWQLMRQLDTHPEEFSARQHRA